MRFVPELFEKIEGDEPLAVNTRVTVAPYWLLKTTPPAFGSAIRGPYRYYTDGLLDQYEIPSIKSVNINRSKQEDVASCNITIYNAWHEVNVGDPEETGKLGKPGYFWPKRGQGDSSSTWNQSPGTGAYKKNGEWDASFSWRNVIVEDTILFTYQGYGGMPVPGNYRSIDQNLSDGNSVITGVWIVDSVTGDSGGMMNIQCRDIGRLLLDQIVFPPLIPNGVYPPEYTVAGKSAFESPWGPKAKTGVSPASRGEVKVIGWTGSGDADPSNPYQSNLATDGAPSTFSLSEAYPSPNGFDPPYDSFTGPPAVYWEFDVNQPISAIKFTPWAGGYECYISVETPTGWLGDNAIPTSSPDRDIPYIQHIKVPHYVPDGFEKPVDVNLGATPQDLFNAVTVRITFTNLYYSTLPNSSGARYRAGLRDFIIYRLGDSTNNYNPNFDEIPWTYAMTGHPTRGYWIGEQSGTVHGFGDAADYDSSHGHFGDVPISSHGSSDNRIQDLESTPTGKGYWAIDWMGHVWAYGDAVHYGEYTVSDPSTPLGEYQVLPQATGIARTYTGKGYWVSFSNGQIFGFGDATPTFEVIPQTPVATFMEAYSQNNQRFGASYNRLRKATAIAGHPYKMGFVVADGSGQVFSYGEAPNHGQMIERVYNKGGAHSFKINNAEWCNSIVYTTSGNGYWLLFPSGNIAAFGDAINQGPVRVYQPLLEDNIVVKNEPGPTFNADFFRALTWALVRDPDGSGFWVLSAAGEVFSYNAEYWGRPGYQGLTGYRWHEGNFDGEWASIVKEMLMWAGFIFKDGTSNPGPNEAPSILGIIESTGINTDTHISGDRFDKKTIMDVVKEIAEVVAYDFRITEEGGVLFCSPNWWRAGNFDEDRTSIYVSGDSYNRVDPTDPDAVPFIPEVHEKVDLIDHSATLSSADKRSELIIGTESPNPADPSQTAFVRHVPPMANEEILPGISSMRGIQRPGIWIAQLFENMEEARLMAELIGIHAWFAQRTASTSCVGNPLLSINDQVRIIEENTSESFIHLITSIDSNVDLDEGVWEMSLTTHWLGDADNWVITADPNRNSDSPYVVISERLDSWQSRTHRMLEDGSQGAGNKYTVYMTGEFTSATTSIPNNPLWGYSMVDIDTPGTNSNVDFVNLMIYGNGVLWPFDDFNAEWEDGGISFSTALFNSNTAGGIRDIILTAALAPLPYQADDDEGFAEDSSVYISKIVETIMSNQIKNVLVWQDLEGIGYDVERYVEFYNALASSIDDNIPWTVNCFGPNVDLSPKGVDDVAVLGVGVDSRDLQFILDFLDETSTDGLAIRGDFTDSDWAVLIDYIHDEISNNRLVLSVKDPSTSNPSAMASKLGMADVVLWPSDEELDIPESSSNAGWNFDGVIVTSASMTSFRVTTEKLSAILGNSNTISIYDDGVLISSHQLGGINETVAIGNLGSSSQQKTYTYRVSGIPTSNGNGRLKLAFKSNTTETVHIEDNIIVLGN